MIIELSRKCVFFPLSFRYIEDAFDYGGWQARSHMAFMSQANVKLSNTDGAQYR